ncbi:MAG TPA: ABC transporter substrate-binding protein [Ilumatobacteraceae bacterium]|nr:ABC transporter substrate-binding protein [Ilumatobacteraceae bacterium]
MITRTHRTLAVLTAGVLIAACSGRDAAETTTTPPSAVDTTVASGDTTPAGSGDTTTTVAEDPGMSPTTPAATTEVGEITWALYREPNTLDPIYSYDYPENTVLTAMCDSLVQQQPDGSLADGIASLAQPDDTTLVFTIRDGVTFWDGSPLTADDVVFSLQRQADVSLGGFYSQVFQYVTGIEATAPNEVTITTSQADAWLAGELSSMPGIIVSKAFAEAAGAAFGTPDGGTMCTGSFALDNWAVGERLSVTRNESYWNGTPLVQAIDFVGVPDEATLVSGLLSGDIDGSYIGPVAAFDRLTSDPSLTVTQGPSYASTALIVSSLDGVLGDVAVRTALSDALDRQGLIDVLYGGAATMPKAVAAPGSWGYSRDVFQAGWDALPEPVQDVEAARAAVEEAGAAGQTLHLATTNEIASIATTVSVIQTAAEDIGLSVELTTVSAANYINLFIDPSARAGIDGFVTVNYSDFADPAALLGTFAVANGSQNYSGYDNPEITALFDQARAELDPDARAELIVQAQALIQQEMVWIPIVHPTTVLVTSAELTGAPSSFVYMHGPWAATLGGV